MLDYASGLDIVQYVWDMQHTVGQHRMVSFCINISCRDKLLKHLVIRTTCVTKCQPKAITYAPMQSGFVQPLSGLSISTENRQN